MMMIRFTIPIAFALVLHGGCTDGDDDGHEHPEIPECVEYALEGCAPLYPATYGQVWEQTFSDGCAEFGTACHAQDDSEGAKNGLTFVDPLVSHEFLVGPSHHGPLIVPGDPLCSPLFVRLVSDDPEIRMPPGTSGLDPGAVCSIGTWISDGAIYVQP
jgi:hypothetical protein